MLRDVCRKRSSLACGPSHFLGQGPSRRVNGLGAITAIRKTQVEPRTEPYCYRGKRTAPDWWHEVRRTEQKTTKLSDESQKLFATIRSEVFGQSAIEKTRSKDAGMETAADILKRV